MFSPKACKRPINEPCTDNKQGARVGERRCAKHLASATSSASSSSGGRTIVLQGHTESAACPRARHGARRTCSRPSRCGTRVLPGGHPRALQRGRQHAHRALHAGAAAALTNVDHSLGRHATDYRTMHACSGAHWMGTSANACDISL
jgi:hypothetical protein